MLRNSISTHVACSRPPALASASVLCTATKSSILQPTSSRAFHSTPFTQESARRQESRLKKSRHQAARTENARLAKTNRPHPALGYAPGNENLWTDSKLCRILLTDAKVQQLSIPTATVEKEMEKVKVSGAEKKKYDFKDEAESTISRMTPKLVGGRPSITSYHTPKVFNFGVGEREKRLIFEDLVEMRKGMHMIQTEEEAAHKEAIDKVSKDRNLSSSVTWSAQDENYIAPEHHFAREKDIDYYENSNKYWLGRLLDIKNANASGLEFENKRRIVEAFSTQGKPEDPGLPEVQAALKTYRIHVIWDHLQTKKNDIHNRRRLMGMIHERAKILHYLRQTYRARYEALLPDLGLERGAVEGQLQLSRQMTPV
ncbi:hypothetical protein M408DRAFT_327227 [Serendipita vermifera MAFF 305830]|uniref:S15/NS1 RNA-binding domain-containing protein n=1 Tax=Serendipita vermifera MAFF 305830 TaxID=933852 RepID=A0A0C2X0I6_SERVB|nr:hypothetical protein M408DRAFT_327227 [Serendipita vermifera MAFF 305830]